MGKMTLSELKTTFDNLQQSSDEKKVCALENEFAIKYTYEGLQFEGTNKVNLKDCTILINGEKKLNYTAREIKEILNHYGAYSSMLKDARANKPLTSELIKDLHEILTDEIIQGGIYRNFDIQIPGAPKQPPSHLKVYEKMDRFFENLAQYQNPLEKASYAHLALQKIHPFLDANGRLARLVLNYILVQNNFLPVIFLNKERQAYFAAIEEYKTNKDIKPFVTLLEATLLARYQDAISFFK